jgi:hypothetical protein
MISNEGIGIIAAQIAEPDFEVSKPNIDKLIGHLDAADQDIVLGRAAKISRQRGEADLAEARSLQNLRRLGKAAGCPDGEPVIPWLEARDLIEQVEGGGWRFKQASPKAAG